jgi:hypothetical protein
MEDDTQATSPETVEDAGAETQEEAQEEQVEEAVVESQAPSADDIISRAGEQAFQRMASWQGRRDKDLLDNVGHIIDSKFQQSQAAPKEDTTIYDDPDGWINKKFQETMPHMVNQEIQRRTTQDQQYTSEVIQYAGRIMDADPLFQDKALGNEVINEVQKTFGKVNKGLNPDVSAQLLVSNAYTNVMRKKNVKANPLAGNGGAKGVGGVTAPVGTSPKAKPVKLTAEAQKLATRWGYSDEDLGKVFGE